MRWIPPLPATINGLLNTACTNGLVRLSVGVGRITPSFRRLFLDTVERLVRRFRPALRDSGHRRAFDALIAVWAGEAGALSMSGLPIPLDAMNLLANVHNLTEVGRLEAGVKQLWDQADRVTESEVNE